ncbi:uncharacterized protein LOC106457481 isoform X2 [Limulus polyphemus]|nr:uncharacterized protein LOC106457481 isoform X2 [Limulus polyphemus]XP_022239140.1 uncharacterized protein LOC106457481 isoform X2 [Limulus polyphemus]XP_022239141.1 uncharacterized protein LOC106457481 isoform X2 [Limulus polyphemus]XP_022239142.1 uncharacterized protein LOC106457481 isoform X2 [Limulus polyphemus]XP_022239143.1 uncharacterized protein LOC106457481 isoform X2 [Limulus polyphemus]XP_022239144.1 uncharacterized protein LOC106457481 isoform X2 [Limulus polyphemus]XP_02223914
MMYICWLFLLLLTVASRSTAFPRPSSSSLGEGSAATLIPWVGRSTKHALKANPNGEKFVQPEFSTTVPLPHGFKLGNKKEHISSFTNDTGHNPFVDLLEGTVPPRNLSFPDFATQTETTLPNHQLSSDETKRHFDITHLPLDRRTVENKRYNNFPKESVSFYETTRSSEVPRETNKERHFRFMPPYEQPVEGNSEGHNRWRSIIEDKSRTAIYPRGRFIFEGYTLSVKQESATTAAIARTMAAQASSPITDDISTKLDQLSHTNDFTTVPNVAESSTFLQDKTSTIIKEHGLTESSFDDSNGEKLHDATIRNIIIGAVISAVAVVFFATFLIVCRWRQRSKRMTKRSEKFIDEVSSSTSSETHGKTRSPPVFPSSRRT